MTFELNATPSTVRATAAAIGRAALFDDKVTEGDKGRIAAWSEALEPIGLDQADMLSAVTTYYQGNPNGRTIQVADIIRCGRELRRDRAEREKATEAVGITPPDKALGGLPIRGADGKPILAAYQVNSALSRKCPHCNSDIGQYCWNHVTREDRKVPCLARMTA